MENASIFGSSIFGTLLHAILYRRYSNPEKFNAIFNIYDGAKSKYDLIFGPVHYFNFILEHNVRYQVQVHFHPFSSLTSTLKIILSDPRESYRMADNLRVSSIPIIEGS